MAMIDFFRHYEGWVDQFFILMMAPPMALEYSARRCGG
jgi:hypothetical protein